jgi:hypothetical protein
VDRFPFDPYDFFGYLAAGLLVVVGMDIMLGFPRVLGQDLKTVDTALLVLAIYIAGQLVATPAKAILEDGVVDKILGRPNLNLFREKRPWVRWLLFPGFYKPLPPEIQKRVHAKAKSDGAPAKGEALFLYVRYHPQMVANEKMMTKLASFLNKYGFARNLAFTSTMVGVALLVKSRFALGPITPESTRYAWTALVAGVLLFYRYLKFFRQYSYEMFNTYAGLKTSESGPAKN